jgi:branched-chain amino acid transport system substrate-binding protein
VTVDPKKELPISTPTSNTETSGDPKGTSNILYLAYQGPLTGSEESLGQSQLAAVKFAVSKYNLSQSSSRVELILADDQGDQTIAANIASEIASNKAILGVVGPAYSATTVASLPFYKAAGLALISPSAGRPSLTDRTSSEFGGPIFHRVVGADSAQGQALAKLATNGNKAAKVFIVSDQNQYSLNLAGYVTAALKKIPGASLVGSGSVTDTTANFAPTITKIKTAGADVVVYTGYYNQAAVFIKQLRESGSKAIFSGGDGVFLQDFLKLAGSAAEGSRFIGLPVLADINPALEDEYINSTGMSSDVFAVSSIDSTNVFLSGITAGVRSRAEMLSFVKSKTGSRISLSGKDVYFDDKGDVIDPDISSFLVSGGRFKYLKPGTENAVFEKISADAKTEAEKIIADDKPKAVVSTKTTITCVKGKLTKKVTDIKPVCPKGYKKK